MVLNIKKENLPNLRFSRGSLAEDSVF